MLLKLLELCKNDNTIKKSKRINLEDRINYLSELNINMGQPGFLLTETAKFFI